MNCNVMALILRHTVTCLFLFHKLAITKIIDWHGYVRDPFRID
jgi:hypothetical protein